MDRKISRFKIGIFIIVCSGLIAAVVVWLALSRYFEDTVTYATFLDESVRGLQEDAVINYRGISVGRVKAIELAPDGRLIQILMALRTDFDVAEDMAVQLREQGLTGLRYLEIDTAPENLEELTPALGFTSRRPVIPSIPSEFEQLKTALETLYGKVMAIDPEDALEDLENTLAAVTETALSSAALIERLTGLVTEENLEANLENLAAVLESTRGVAAALENQLEGVPEGAAAELMRRMSRTVGLTEGLVAGLDQRLGESSVLIGQTLQKFEQLADRLNTLVETIQQQPSRLILPSEKTDPFER